MANLANMRDLLVWSLRAGLFFYADVGNVQEVL